MFYQQLQYCNFCLTTCKTYITINGEVIHICKDCTTNPINKLLIIATPFGLKRTEEQLLEKLNHPKLPL
jgi:hypothetical protein